VARQVFFTEGADESPIRPGFLMNAVVTITMVMTLAIALYGQPFIKLAESSAQVLAAAF
jgi:NADH:ubiquinone oxidoreductase subunit 2 (subunit N)